MGRAHSDRSLEPHADLGASTPPTLIAAASVPGASRPHSSLAHCPMSSSTVESTGAAPLGTERAVIALVIATLSVICITSIGDERLAGVVHNGHNRCALGGARALLVGRGRHHPDGRPRGEQAAREGLTGPQRAMDGSDAAGAGMRPWRANLSQSGIRRASRPFHRRCSPLGALLVKKIARADAHGDPLQLLTG